MKLPQISGKDLIKITVPIHQQLKRGTLSYIIKASKVDTKELEKYF